MQLADAWYRQKEESHFRSHSLPSPRTGQFRHTSVRVWSRKLFIPSISICLTLEWMPTEQELNSYFDDDFSNLVTPQHLVYERFFEFVETLHEAGQPLQVAADQLWHQLIEECLLEVQVVRSHEAAKRDTVQKQSEKKAWIELVHLPFRDKCQRIAYPVREAVPTKLRQHATSNDCRVWCGYVKKGIEDFSADPIEKGLKRSQTTQLVVNVGASVHDVLGAYGSECFNAPVRARDSNNLPSPLSC